MRNFFAIGVALFCLVGPARADGLSDFLMSFASTAPDATKQVKSSSEGLCFNSAEDVRDAFDGLPESEVHPMYTARLQRGRKCWYPKFERSRVYAAIKNVQYAHKDRKPAKVASARGPIVIGVSPISATTGAVHKDDPVAQKTRTQAIDALIPADPTPKQEVATPAVEAPVGLVNTSPEARDSRLRMVDELIPPSTLQPMSTRGIDFLHEYFPLEMSPFTVQNFGK